MPGMPKIWRRALWILPLVAIPAAFFAILPMLKTLSPPIVLLIVTTFMIFAMGYSNYLSYRALRRLDEVQKAGAAFAAQWGAPVGQAAFALLLVLSPFGDFTIAIVNKLIAAPGTIMDPTVVVGALSVGFCTLLLLQAMGTVVVQAIWWTARR